MALYHKTTPEHHVLERHEGQTWGFSWKSKKGENGDNEKDEAQHLEKR